MNDETEREFTSCVSGLFEIPFLLVVLLLLLLLLFFSFVVSYMSKTTGKGAPCARTGDIKASGCSLALSWVPVHRPMPRRNQRTHP